MLFAIKLYCSSSSLICLSKKSSSLVARYFAARLAYSSEKLSASFLFELEKRIPAEQYSVFHARFYGRVSELLFNVWLKQYSQFKLLKVKAIPFVYGEKINWLKKGTAFLMAKFFGKKYEKSF